jgi:anthraniloyl-CoA monooxygenase
MRVAVAGGGPGGLFLAALIRKLDPSIEVTVFERNRADDTFGFGVVFSDRTLAGIFEADPVLREALDAHGRHWDAIEVRLKGERIRCGGNGMAAIVRRTLLGLLQERARGLGAEPLQVVGGLDEGARLVPQLRLHVARVRLRLHQREGEHERRERHHHPVGVPREMSRSVLKFGGRRDGCGG